MAINSFSTSSPAWQALEAHRTATSAVTLNDLFKAEGDRAQRRTLTLDGLTLDFSRTHLNDETIRLLTALAEARDLASERERLFTGAKINNTENRPALHPALRHFGPEPLMIDGRDVMIGIRDARVRMAALAEVVRSGKWKGATGQPIKDIVNIGIGGSDLGPRLVVGALCAFADGPRAHFVANVDAADILGVLTGLDPATTLFIVVSKTFSTQETRMNATTARRWLVEKLGPEAVARHFAAVSTNQQAASEFGIPPANVFPMEEGVGGRTSLWSGVGLSIAVALGWNRFEELLKGAAVLDEHFRTAPFAQNLPVILALIGVWYRNFVKTACHAVLPYSERLRDLPRFLQQLEMESNGKSVTRDGEPVFCATAPAIIGECGTIGQHSFHQWLHQGTDVTPCDFIGIREDDLNQPEHHRALLANMAAQADALRQGQASDDPHRVNPGNRPSALLWLDRLDPYHLGLLLALYEHKVFTQGIVWGINSFDQWGVELGKKLAAAALIR